MNNKYTPHIVALIFSVGSASTVQSEDLPGIKVTFPAVKLACIPFQLPVDAVEAQATIEEERKKWYATARSGKLQKSGYPFVDAKISPVENGTDSGAVPIDAHMCAVVENSVISIPNMEIDDVPKVDGFAGFYVAQKVKDCLARAFMDSGFTQERPWPRLPIYARWPNEEPDPINVIKVIAYLSTPTKEIPPEMSGQGDTYERSTNGLQPLVPCDASGCPQQAVNPPEESKRIGWFIPASPTPPPPSPPDNPPRATN